MKLGHRGRTPSLPRQEFATTSLSERDLGSIRLRWLRTASTAAQIGEKTGE